VCHHRCGGILDDGLAFVVKYGQLSTVLSSGVVIWGCHLEVSSGVVIWGCHLMLSSDVVI
jgi:hypothetical protein